MVIGKIMVVKSVVISATEVEHKSVVYEVGYTIWNDKSLSISSIEPIPPTDANIAELLREKLTPNTPSAHNHF
jgi:hypothetical protein